MMLVIAIDLLEVLELTAVVGQAKLKYGRGVRTGIAIYAVGQHFGQRFDSVMVRTQTMKAITADPVKWAWWREAVLTRLPPGTRPEYI